MSDVTQGLPRVEELFEVRRPKNLAPVAEITGKVQVSKVDDGYVIRVRNTKVKPAEEREYFVPLTSNSRALRFAHTVQIPPTASNGLSSPSVAMAFQLRGVDVKRLERKVGVLAAGEVKLLNREIKKMLKV